MRFGKWLGIMMLLLVAGACSSVEPEPLRTWSNPVALPDEWEEYGLGDPFIFAFNGYYYLYVSTRDTDAGIKVWSSPNLVDWTYRGLCTEDPVTTAAYAPEVRYWNGKFYMYTSPAGNGHYVLESDSPVGPFRVATDNFGRTIDASTFVDDDGTWYFYYAGTGGIDAAPMDSPLSVTASGSPTGAYMGGWTEGPTVFKRNGLYYMTYTGNHVFSNGYRIDAAVSESPLGPFEPFEGNPVLIRTEGKTVGLGHNSLVTGPDLDSMYMIYHNLEGPGVVGPLRHMNMDRLFWNGDRFAVAGPTDTPQPAPALPVFADRFERDILGKSWLKSGKGEWSVDAKKGAGVRAANAAGIAMLRTKSETEPGYTAEFYVRSESEAKAESRVGAVFSYRDKQNYGTVWLIPEAGVMELTERSGGRERVLGSAALPADFDYSQWHKIRIEHAAAGKAGNTGNAHIRVYIDEMQKFAGPASTGGGAIGYAAAGLDGRFGYVAYSNDVNGSSDGRVHQPLPGQVQAVHFEEGKEGKAYHAVSKANADGKPAYRPGTLSMKSGGDGGYVLSGLRTGEWANYLMNVNESGQYSIHFRIRPLTESVAFRLVDQDGEEIAAFSAAREKAGEWQTISVSGIDLPAGRQRWKLEVTAGTVDLDWFRVARYQPVEKWEDNFDDGNDFGWTRFEGMWSVKDGELRASSVSPAKSLAGEPGWSDYTVEAHLQRMENTGRAGILVRASEPANGLDQNQNRNDFVRGYYIYADAEGLHLDKINYGTTRLKSVPLPAEAASVSGDGKLQLKVSVRGAMIEVYAGNSNQPVFSYTDRSATPFLQGRIGLQSADVAVRIDWIGAEPLH
ncbi:MULTISPECIES: family 43 glycosylhydrolase [Paenibacillus]|uniref:family 43 glycosylhydrolase n=1 Tax=Paenibacillus TaxID=44249 RepID=UPI002FDF2AF8